MCCLSTGSSIDFTRGMMKKNARLLKCIGLNVVGCIAVYFLLTGIVFKQQDYAWSIDMLEDNYDFILDNRSMNLQERYTSKLGVSYSLFDSIRSKTPDSAVIYLPGREAFFPKNQVSIFSGEPFGKLWAIRFLYPRKIVSEAEYQRSTYADKIDYVIIVYEKGVERLKYTLPSPIEFGILYADSLKLTSN